MGGQRLLVFCFLGTGGIRHWGNKEQVGKATGAVRHWKGKALGESSTFREKLSKTARKTQLYDIAKNKAR